MLEKEDNNEGLLYATSDNVPYIFTCTGTGGDVIGRRDDNDSLHASSVHDHAMLCYVC